MPCKGSGDTNEHEFVAQVVRERTDYLDCCGPLVRSGFTALQLYRIEEAFQSTAAHDLLWDGFDPDPIDAMYFTLCALHWLELACLVSLRGHQYDDSEWRVTGADLVYKICATQTWDPKEIANAFTWQQVRLT